MKSLGSGRSAVEPSSRPSAWLALSSSEYSGSIPVEVMVAMAWGYTPAPAPRQSSRRDNALFHVECSSEMHLSRIAQVHYSIFAVFWNKDKPYSRNLQYGRPVSSNCVILKEPAERRRSLTDCPCRPCLKTEYGKLFVGRLFVLAADFLRQLGALRVDAQPAAVRLLEDVGKHALFVHLA